MPLPPVQILNHQLHEDLGNELDRGLVIRDLTRQFNDLYNLLNPVQVLIILQICDWFYIFLKLLGKGCFLSKYLVSKH